MEHHFETLPDISVLGLPNLPNDCIERVYKYMIDKVARKVKYGCTPKIKGKITVGKLKWRGIKIERKPNTRYLTYLIYQRGKLLHEYETDSLAFDVNFRKPTKIKQVKKSGIKLTFT
jgi:hypothetical protein